jgi:hypothetical protein
VTPIRAMDLARQHVAIDRIEGSDSQGMRRSEILEWWIKQNPK